MGLARSSSAATRITTRRSRRAGVGRVSTSQYQVRPASSLRPVCLPSRHSFMARISASRFSATQCARVRSRRWVMLTPRSTVLSTTAARAMASTARATMTSSRVKPLLFRVQLDRAIDARLQAVGPLQVGVSQD